MKNRIISNNGKKKKKLWALLALGEPLAQNQNGPGLYCFTLESN